MRYLILHVERGALQLEINERIPELAGLGISKGAYWGLFAFVGRVSCNVFKDVFIPENAILDILLVSKSPYYPAVLCNRELDNVALYLKQEVVAVEAI
jgi:hypothetical protein